MFSILSPDSALEKNNKNISNASYGIKGMFKKINGIFEKITGIFSEINGSVCGREEKENYYRDSIRNSPRHFTDKAVMRDQIVPKVYCEPLHRE